MKRDRLITALGPLEGLHLLLPTSLGVHSAQFVKARELNAEEALSPDTDVIVIDARTVHGVEGNPLVRVNPLGYVMNSSEIQSVRYRRSVDVPGVLLFDLRSMKRESAITHYLFGTVEAVDRSAKLANDLGLLEAQGE